MQFAIFQCFIFVSVVFQSVNRFRMMLLYGDRVRRQSTNTRLKEGKKLDATCQPVG